MKPLVFLLAFSAVAIAFPASALNQDEARKCDVMAKTFDGKIAEVEALKTARAEAAEAAEAAGEAWENAEPMRDFGEAQAAEANATRAAFNAAKQTFEGKDAALRSATQMLNRDIAVYNQSCASDG